MAPFSRYAISSLLWLTCTFSVVVYLSSSTSSVSMISPPTASFKETPFTGASPPFATISVLNGLTRRAIRGFRKLFAHELDAFSNPEAGHHDERVLDLIKSVPGAVQEGHKETLHSLRSLLSQAITQGIVRALRAKFQEPNTLGGVGAALFRLTRTRKDVGEIPRSKAIICENQCGHDLRTTLNRVMEAFAVHVMRYREGGEQVAQAQTYLACLQNQIALVPDSNVRIELIEQILVSLRHVTDNGLIPEADGRRREIAGQQKKVVNAFAPEVLNMLHQLEKDIGSAATTNARLQLDIAEASGMYLGALSSVSAARELNTLRKMMHSLDLAIQHGRDTDSGLPLLMRGMFYLSVPAPFKSVHKAKEHFHQALQVNPKSGRNLYFCGLASFLDGKYSRAEAYYMAAQESLPSEIRQNAQYAFFKEQCRQGIALSRRRRAEKGEGLVGVLA